MLVNPGCPINNAEIHGITDEMVQELGWPAEDVINGLMLHMRNAVEMEMPIVIFNAPYDWTTLHAHAARLGIEWDLAEAIIIDPMVLDKQIDKWRSGGRKQADVARHYGIEIVGDLHTAAVDADLAVQIARAMGRGYPSLSDLDFAPRQKQWAINQQRDLQRYFAKKGGGSLVHIGWPIAEPIINPNSEAANWGRPV